MAWTTFLINLDASVDRLKTCEKNFARIGAKFERVPAVWGRDLSDEEIASVYEKSNARAHYKELNSGEVGCYLSHIKAWKLIVERKLDFAFIFEDDVSCLDVSLEALVESVKMIPSPWFYIKLGGFHRSGDIIKSESVGEFDLVTFKKVPNRTPSQIVSYEGAKNLLGASERFFRPLDIDLRYWWEKDIYIQALLPYSFMPNDEIKSEIQKISSRKSAKKSILKGWLQKVLFYFRCRIEGRRLLRNLK